MSDEPELEYHDLDRDGIPDALDLQVDPAPVEASLMDAPLSDEELLEMQRQAQEQGEMANVLTNIQNMKHESLKGIANNLRG